jgi:hypothetical protein
MTRVRGLAARVAAKLGELARRLREQTVALTTALRDGGRRESRRRRLLWLAVAALLVIGPLAFNLAREPGFDASVALFPRAVQPYPAVRDPRYYETLLEDPELRRQMGLNVGVGAVDFDDVSFRRGPGILRVTLTVKAGTPEDAQRIANAVAPQIAGATSRRLGRRADRDQARLRERFLTLDPGPERLRVRRRLRRLAQFGEFPPPRVLPGAAAPRPSMDRWADRVVDDLPGDFRERPSPWWAALAGLLVAVTLWAIGLVLFPPRRV